MTDKSILQLPLATTPTGALLYGVQDNMDKAFSPTVLLGTEQAQAANFVYAGPVGPPGAVPSFRKLVVNDIPDLSALYMRTTGGALVSPIISNPTITGGNISGSTIVVDDDKFRVRNATDTTKVIRFSAANITPGQTRIYSWPDLTGDVVTHNATQDLVNKSLFLRSSTAPLATFRIPHGVPPSDPVDGDMWTTAGGLYVRISGVTVGPLAAEQTSYVTSFNTRVGAITLLPADVTSALGYTPYNPGTSLNTPGSVTATSFTDSVGNLRTGSGGLDTKVSKAGDTMVGELRVHASIIQGPPGNAQLSIGSDATTVYLESSMYSSGGARRNLNLYGSNLNINVPGTHMYGDMNFRVGTPDTQQVFTRYAWNNNDIKWAWAMEQGAHLALYRYAGSAIQQTVFVYDTGAFTNTGGIGSVGPSAGFNWRSRNTNVGYVMYAQNSNMAIFCEGVGDLLTIDTSGNAGFRGVVYANGGFQNTSDPRTKDASTFRPLNSALDKLSNLNVHYGKYHDWANADGKERVFLMADNAFKQALPQAVSTGTVKIDNKEYDSWDVAQMVAVLVKATQELHQEVNDLKEKINELTR